MTDPQVRAWLHRILDAVRAFGSAHDARDRGYYDSADRIDREETEVIRRLCRESVALQELLPVLWERVVANEPLADEGHAISAEVQAALRRVEG